MTQNDRALVVALLLGLAACHKHPDDAVQVSQGACVSCHSPDYQAATDPPHVDRMPDTCGDCHSQDAWRPALEGGHPEAFFPVAEGDHAGIQCNDCHDLERGPSADGENTDCIGCHTGDHSRAETDDEHGGVPDYRFEPEVPSFCLRCHPDGRAEDHPEDRFPIANGPHESFECGECHDADLGPSTGGANADCIGCHTGDHSMSRMDDKHDEVGDYQWQPSVPDFCRECHPSGREEDD